jgi:glycine cleavage system transcriptional repressor
MLNFLVFAVVGTNRPGLLDAFSKLIRDCGGNIADSRMTVLGGEFSMIMLVSGTWDVIAKIESALPRLEDSLTVRIVSKRTDARKTGVDLIPYAVEVVSYDHSGIVYEIASFFSARDINIEDVYTTGYAAAHTGAPMFSLHMTISVPSNTSIAALRGEFMEFCDRLNLDSIMEPVK